MFDQFFFKNRYLILFSLLGLILVSLGFFIFKNVGLPSQDKIEVLDSSSESEDTIKEVVVEISGSVEKPGVYRFTQGSRVDDLLISSGGLSSSADRSWVEKNINRAQKLFDGQKLYIPKEGDTTNNELVLSISVDNSGLININTSDLKTLDSLPGIGPVYAQKIIDHRPYSNIQDMVSKGGLSQSLADKIKDLIVF